MQKGVFPIKKVEISQIWDKSPKIFAHKKKIIAEASHSRVAQWVGQKEKFEWITMIRQNLQLKPKTIEYLTLYLCLFFSFFFFQGNCVKQGWLNSAVISFEISQLIQKVGQTRVRFFVDSMIKTKVKDWYGAKHPVFLIHV